MSQVRRLQQLFDHIQTEGRASRSDALRVLALARELAEARGELHSYPTLRFFADWSLHSKLDRTAARSLLSNIERIVEQHWSGDSGPIVTEVSRALSVSALRDQLRELLVKAGLPVFMLALPEPWQQFASWLLQDLLDKPVIGSDFTQEEEKSGWGTTPRVLRLVAESGPGNPIMWEINLGPRVILRGRLLRA